MSDANNVGSVNTGSPATDPALMSPAGQSADNGQGVNYEAAYKELESKFGSQGNELGEYRTFVENLTPLLEKLDANPELVRAIVDGKIDQQLVQAVSEGKVSIQDAQVVTAASQAVASTVGQRVLETMTPEKIEALVEAKANDIRRELEQKAELQSFEEHTQKFIESTPDFIEYAEEIDKWLDAHSNISDVEVAYYAVKGQLSNSQAAKAAEEAAAIRQKENMMNAGGGSSYATSAPDGTSLIDRLVGGSSNPLH